MNDQLRHRDIEQDNGPGCAVMGAVCASMIFVLCLAVIGFFCIIKHYIL